MTMMVHFKVNVLFSLFYLIHGMLSVTLGSSFIVQKSLFYGENLVDTSNKLERQINTACLPDKIEVTFSRKFMAKVGIAPDQISLKDPQCTPQVNDTHYILHIKFDDERQQCGFTTSENTIIHNSVRFNPPKLREDEADNTDDDDAYFEPGSGFESLGIIELPFQCKYQRTTNSPTLPIRARPTDKAPCAADTDSSAHCKCPQMLVRRQGIKLEFTIMVAAFSFVLGIVVVLVFWCVHTKTDPRRKMHQVPTSDSESGSSRTPIGLSPDSKL